MTADLTELERAKWDVLQTLQRAMNAELQIKEMEFRHLVSDRTGIPPAMIGFDPMGRIRDMRITVADETGELPTTIDAPRRKRKASPKTNGHSEVEPPVVAVAESP